MAASRLKNCEKSYKLLNLFREQKRKMQLAMCIRCLDILYIKRTDSRSSKSQKKERRVSVVEAIQFRVEKLQQCFINVPPFFIMGLVFTKGASALLIPSSVTAIIRCRRCVFPGRDDELLKLAKSKRNPNFTANE